MTLKEELEILRGEPIKVFEGNPLDIPCIETSDAEKLCKNPVVSVHMVTYNHEPYIRKAIEGVMMQQTDFEFELIIGEDCSQDKTREICFEYQKKYPDKIRVLWWHENVSKFGGNSRRVFARCRGEFIAFCEGDDYWTDPLKLQKQVDIMRRTGAVMCVANCELKSFDGTISPYVYKKKDLFISLDELIQHYFHTTTYLLRREVFLQCLMEYSEFVYWYDIVITCCMATKGAVCFLPEIVSVYNWTGEGIAGKPQSAIRFRLFLTQYTQFSLCSIRMVALAYYSRVKHYFPLACAAYSPKGNVFNLKESIRIIRVALHLAYFHEGVGGWIRMLLRGGLRFFQRLCRPYYRFLRVCLKGK